MSQTYRVDGMTCGGCAKSVETAIKAVAPAAQVSVNLEKAQITVDGASEDAIRGAVDGAGFDFKGAA